jgi:hypothetical protein
MSRGPLRTSETAIWKRWMANGKAGNRLKPIVATREELDEFKYALALRAVPEDKAWHTLRSPPGSPHVIGGALIVDENGEPYRTG